MNFPNGKLRGARLRWQRTSAQQIPDLWEASEECRGDNRPQFKRYPMRWASRLLPHTEHCNASISSSVHRCVDVSGCMRRVFRPAYCRGECQASGSHRPGVRNALRHSQSMRRAHVRATRWGLWMPQRISCVLTGRTVGTGGKCRGCAAKCIGALGSKLRNSNRPLRLRRSPCAGMRCHCGLPVGSVLIAGP
jgi:hypothetical protein